VAVFRVANRRTRRGTHDMIMAMAKYGNHYIKSDDYTHPFKTDADVKRYFEEDGYDYRDVVDDCRDKDAHVPAMENVLGSGYTIDSSGGRVSYVDKSGEETIIGEDEGPGQFSYPSYAGLFEKAVKDFNRCLDSADYDHFLSCVSFGVSSVEAYFNQEVKVYNKRNPRKRHLIENKRNKVSFDDQIDKWIPTMTGGKKLDKGDQRWQHFKRLRASRDSNQAHVKVSVIGANHRRLGEVLNCFSTGIAGMLLALHILFEDRTTPATIIRHAYLPPGQMVIAPA
jgi:hypothetical protein